MELKQIKQFWIFSLLLMFIFAITCANVSAEERWTTKAPMLTLRSGAAVAVVKGEIYVIGGYNADAGRANYFSLNEKYNPKTDTWTTLTPMPMPRSGAFAAVVNHKIYVIGGVDKNTIPLNLIECYDPKTDTWATLSPMPTPRAGVAVAVVKDKIYAIGGGRMPLFAEFTAVNEEYDPLTGKWVTKKPMSSACWRPAVSVVGDKIYLFGGWGKNGITNQNKRYDPATDTWISLSPMPTGRTATTASVVNNKIYVIGGYHWEEDEDGFPADFLFLSNNQEYDVNLNSWTRRLSMPKARAGVVSGAIDNKIYLIGGAFNQHNYTGLNEEYTPPDSK